MRLKPELVTTEAFAPFGQLVAAPGTYGRRSFADGLSHDDRLPVLSTTSVRASSLPMTVAELERHPHSSQTFIPLDVARWLVVVSTSLAHIDIRVFVVGAGVGITIGRGIWHYGLTALDADARFVVMMWKDGASDDEFAPVEPIQIDAA